MKKKLLKTLVDGLKPAAKDVLVWDSEITGFVLKVTPAGKKIYALNYYIDGKRRQIKLGDHGTLAPEDARNKALDHLRLIDKGADPLTVKASAKTAPTMNDLFDEYMKRHAREHKKPRSADEDQKLIDGHIKPAFGDCKVAKLTRPMVADLHYKLHETPTTANRTLALISKMMNLAELWGYRPDGTNPCRHIARNKETKRKRYLSIEEIGRLAAVLTEEEKLGNASYVAIQGIRLLLLSGMRMGEVLSLEWEWVDLDGQRIDLPDSKTGAKTIWLNAAAVAVLETLRAYQARRAAEFEKKGEEWLGGRWVLPGRTNGEPLQWLESAWQRIRKTAKVEDVRIHDLRHTMASIGAGEGLGLPIIGALLGHTPGSDNRTLRPRGPISGTGRSRVDRPADSGSDDRCGQGG